jgi:hypothetical protein
MNKQEIEKAIKTLEEIKIHPDQAGETRFDMALIIAMGCMSQQLNNGWIPVSEQLPIIPQEKIDEGFNRVAVLVTSKHEDMTVIEWFDPEEGIFYDDWDLLASKDEYVTAWMPLPSQYTTNERFI